MEFISIIYDFITGLINLITTVIQCIIDNPIIITFILMVFARAWFLKHS